MLTAQWTRKLPFIQETVPAELAARLIHAFLDDFPDIDSEQYFVIDFCSGAGGKQIQKCCDPEHCCGGMVMPALLGRIFDLDMIAHSYNHLHDTLPNIETSPNPQVKLQI